jgi:hypothetical protein
MEPIFIAGSGRCGTSILKGCLGRHKNIGVTNFEPMLFISADESSGLVYLVQECGASDRVRRCITYLKKRFKFESGKKEYGYFKYISKECYERLLMELEANLPSGEYVFSKMKNKIVTAIRKFILYLYTSCGIANDFWLDDHILNGLYVQEIKIIFPKSIFIHIIRDGRDVASSYVRKGWARSSFELALKIWHQRVIHTRSLCKEYAADSYIEVSFSSLVEGPEGVIRGLCVFIELEFEPVLLSLFSKGRANEYTPIYTPRQNRYFVSIAKDLQVEFYWDF